MELDDSINSFSLDDKEDVGKSPELVVKRWKLELKLADKREDKWRETVRRIYKLYTPLEPALNSFNILWTNTETLRQATYNSLPQPDVRRRYSDEDAIGKAVCEVLTRSLEFAQDTYDFDSVLKGDVLSMLLPGRAVSRVRYIPDIRAVGGEDTSEDGDEEAQESETYEEIEWEQVICERIQWDDFRILCAAKTWDEVTAIAFRHRLTREDCIDKFGEEIGKAIKLDSVDDDDVKKAKDVGDLFKTAEVWEIWDKDEKEVIFISPGYDLPCKEQDDPLQLSGFFPIPRPLYAIENDQTLVPSPLYVQYENQAKELNKITLRINKLSDVLKVRGIYDATLTELSELMKAADGELIPAQNVTALLERGGLEKAIWMMPLETVAAVLKELYMQRDAAKQVIYEITGISDIMRSASDPNETYGAQKIKTQWGTQRLQRMQKEVQRYIRDLIRLKAEIIAEKFQPETLEKMTLIELPHQAQIDAQKQQVMMQYQQAVQQWHMQAAQAQQTGQQPPQQPQPPQFPPDPPTWEAVVQSMHDDATRTYRVDIETDSTLSATQDADVAELKAVYDAIGGIMKEFGPAVQQGAMDIEVLKQLMLVAVRRFRMGTAVEDIIDKIKQPPPAPDPNAAKAQADQQQQQAQIQHEQQLAQMKAQTDAQIAQQNAQNQVQIEQMKAQVAQASEQARMQADQQVEQARAQASIEVERAKLAAQFQVDEANRQHAAQIAQMGHQHEAGMGAQEMQFNKWKAELDATSKILIAQIAAQTTLSAAAQAAEDKADSAVSGAL